MLNYVLLKKSQLEDIGEALRYKLDVEDQFLVDDMAEAVLNIGNGETFIGDDNGFYDVGKYSQFSITPRWLYYAMYFQFNEYILSKYSDELINWYGAYLDININENPVYRCAYAVTNMGAHYPTRTAFISFKNFTTAKYSITFVPFGSDRHKIKFDGLHRSDINTRTLSWNSAGYYSGGLGADLEDANGNLLTNYTANTASNRCKVFYTQQEAIDYVLGRID